MPRKKKSKQNLDIVYSYAEMESILMGFPIEGKMCTIEDLFMYFAPIDSSSGDLIKKIIETNSYVLDYKDYSRCVSVNEVNSGAVIYFNTEDEYLDRNLYIETNDLTKANVYCISDEVQDMKNTFRLHVLYAIRNYFNNQIIEENALLTSLFLPKNDNSWENGVNDGNSQHFYDNLDSLLRYIEDNAHFNSILIFELVKLNREFYSNANDPYISGKSEEGHYQYICYFNGMKVKDVIDLLEKLKYYIRKKVLFTNPLIGSPVKLNDLIVDFLREDSSDHNSLVMLSQIMQLNYPFENFKMYKVNDTKYPILLYNQCIDNFYGIDFNDVDLIFSSKYVTSGNYIQCYEIDYKLSETSSDILLSVDKKPNMNANVYLKLIEDGKFYAVLVPTLTNTSPIIKKYYARIGSNIFNTYSFLETYQFPKKILLTYVINSDGFVSYRCDVNLSCFNLSTLKENTETDKKQSVTKILHYSYRQNPSISFEMMWDMYDYNRRKVKYSIANEYKKNNFTYLIYLAEFDGKVIYNSGLKNILDNPINELIEVTPNYMILLTVNSGYSDEAL